MKRLKSESQTEQQVASNFYFATGFGTAVGILVLQEMAQCILKTRGFP